MTDTAVSTEVVKTPIVGESVGPWSGIELGELFSKGYFIGGRHSDIVRVGVSLACWEVISQDVAKTPLELRRRTPQGSVLVQPGEHPLADLLWNRPSSYYGWKEFLRMMAAFLAAQRIYWIAARTDRRGKLLELQGLPHTAVETRVNVDAGRYFYRVWPQSDHDRIQWSWLENETALSDGDMTAVRLRSLNGFDPISNSSVARETLDLLNAMRSFQMGNFTSGGLGVTALVFPQELSQPQIDRLKVDMKKAIDRSRRDGTPLILEGADGVTPDVKKLSFSAIDQDFAKSQTEAMHDVLRYYRMPPTKVGIFENVKYDNIESINRVYVDDTLVPIFEAIEESFDKLLLSGEADRDLFMRFDRDMAAAMDPVTRNKIVIDQWKGGLLEFDEARAKLNLNTRGGEPGQVRMVSGNFVLIDRDNEVVLKAGGNAPGAEGDQAPQDGNEGGEGNGEKSNVVPLRAG